VGVAIRGVRHARLRSSRSIGNRAHNRAGTSPKSPAHKHTFDASRMRSVSGSGTTGIMDGGKGSPPGRAWGTRPQSKRAKATTPMPTRCPRGTQSAQTPSITATYRDR
jgi:hypothetical protein